MSEKSVVSHYEIKYLLGIDGGGTKTEFLLTDLNEREIKRVVLGASNPVNIGIESTQKILGQGITQVCGDNDLRKVSVFAGLAGGISGDNRVLINDFLSGFGFGAYANGSDTDNALEIALNGENGVAVIMGTGIIGYGQLDGARHRVGGWGYLIDKGGSGFAFGADALDSAFRCSDGRGGSGLILELVEELTGKPLAASVPHIYEGGAACVASFAPVVFEACKRGDGEAERIVDRNAEKAAEIIRACCGFVNGKTEKIVICGGLCRQKEILEPALKKHLGEEYHLRFSTAPMVNGAVSLAKSALGGKIC